MTPLLNFGGTFSKCDESNDKINLTFEQIALNRREEKKVLLDYLQSEFAILNQIQVYSL